MFWLFVASLIALGMLITFKVYEGYSSDLLVFPQTRKQLDRWLVETNQYLSDYVRSGLGWVWLQCSRGIMIIRRSTARGLRSLASRIDRGQ